MSPIITDVPPILEPREEVLQHRMLDGARALITLQISFGYVRRVHRLMNQHMVPGLIFWGARFRDRLVPLLRGLKIRIDVYDYAAIVEQPMINQLTDSKL